MGIIHSAGQRGHQPGGGPGIVPEPAGLLGQARPFDQLHAEIRPVLVFPDLVDRHNVRVVEVRRQLSLPQEPFALLEAGHRARLDHLERNQSLQSLMPGAVDDTHPAPGNFLDQFITADARLGPAVRSGTLMKIGNGCISRRTTITDR